MTDSFLDNAGGYTPVPDKLVREYGFETAYVWGKIWRYCQMANGACTASHQTIADRAGMSRRTLIDKLDKLIEDGYIEDKTPDLKNKPHTYCTKIGEVKITSTMQISHTESDIPDDAASGTDMSMRIPHSDDADNAQSDSPTMQILHTEDAEIAQPTMQNLHLKKDSLETLQETTTEDYSPNGEGSMLPIQENLKSPLEPETQAEVLLFEKINRNRTAKRLRLIKLFQALEQKESCNRQFDRLGQTKFERCIDYWLTQGITALGKLIIKLETWEIKKQKAYSTPVQEKPSILFPTPPDPIPPPPLTPEETTWQKALSDIRQQLPPWLAADIRAVFKRSNGTFKLAVSSEGNKEWVDNRLMKIIQPALSRIDSSIQKVEVVIQ